MLISLKCEITKLKHRKIWLLPLAALLIFLIFINTSKTFILENPKESYYRTMQYLPVLNTLLLPTILAALASRICDVENKGCTYKLLCTLQKKIYIYNSKLFIGFIVIMGLTLAEGGILVLYGWFHFFEQPFPTIVFLQTMSTFILVSMTIYLLQQILSLLLSNQLMALFIGLLGSLTGAFAMLFPIESFARFLPWGYYYVGTPVGMTYDQESRLAACFAVPYNWKWMLFYLCSAAVLYMCGRYLFLKKEV